RPDQSLGSQVKQRVGAGSATSGLADRPMDGGRVGYVALDHPDLAGQSVQLERPALGSAQIEHRHPITALGQRPDQMTTEEALPAGYERSGQMRAFEACQGTSPPAQRSLRVTRSL